MKPCVLVYRHQDSGGLLPTASRYNNDRRSMFCRNVGASIPHTGRRISERHVLNSSAGIRIKATRTGVLV